MKKQAPKPSLYKRINSKDLASFYEVSYQTGNKKFNLIAGKVITLRDTIFPIPQVVIDANLSKTMSQNPGW